MKPYHDICRIYRMCDVVTVDKLKNEKYYVPKLGFKKLRPKMSIVVKGLFPNTYTYHSYQILKESVQYYLHRQLQYLQYSNIVEN